MLQRIAFMGIGFLLASPFFVSADVGDLQELVQSSQHAEEQKTRAVSQEGSVLGAATTRGSQSGGNVLLLIEAAIAGSLQSEIQTYREDIQTEFGYQTIIKLVKPSDTVLLLKQYVLDEYQKGTLKGVLIVGNVPTAYFYNPSEDDSTAEGMSLGDSIYQDTLNACVYSTSKNAFSFEDTRCQMPYSMIRKYWVGRLTPNSSTHDSVTLLKDYFRRNHAYRTGAYAYEKNVLIYTPIFLEQPDALAEKTTSVKDFSNFNEYAPHQIRFVELDANSDEEYLEEGHARHKYESLFYNGHGSPVFHERNLTPNTIGSMSVFFAQFLSCSVGRFTTRDYMAGQYIFSDSLVAIAPSVPVFATQGQAPRDINSVLAAGLPIFEALNIVGTSVGVNLLGDPTLRMRYGSTTPVSISPNIEIETKKLFLSDSARETSFTVKNVGEVPVQFSIAIRYDDTSNAIGKVTSFRIGPPITDSRSTLTLPPHTQAPIEVLLPPVRRADAPPGPGVGSWEGIASGTFTGEVTIVSNDPSRVVTHIPLEVQKRGNATSAPETPEIPKPEYIDPTMCTLRISIPNLFSAFFGMLMSMMPWR